MEAMKNVILDMVAGILALIVSNEPAMFFIVIGIMMSLVSLLYALMGFGRK